MADPIPALTFAATWTAWVALMGGATATVTNLPACDGLDIVTGCDSLRSSLFGIIALGTIPGAPTEVNLAFLLLGLASRATIIWALVRLARGGG